MDKRKLEATQLEAESQRLLSADLRSFHTACGCSLDAAAAAARERTELHFDCMVSCLGLPALVNRPAFEMAILDDLHCSVLVRGQCGRCTYMSRLNAGAAGVAQVHQRAQSMISR